MSLPSMLFLLVTFVRFTGAMNAAGIYVFPESLRKTRPLGHWWTTSVLVSKCR